MLRPLSADQPEAGREGKSARRPLLPREAGASQPGQAGRVRRCSRALGMLTGSGWELWVTAMPAGHEPSSRAGALLQPVPSSSPKQWEDGRELSAGEEGCPGSGRPRAEDAGVEMGQGRPRGAFALWQCRCLNGHCSLALGMSRMQSRPYPGPLHCPAPPAAPRVCPVTPGAPETPAPCMPQG